MRALAAPGIAVRNVTGLYTDKPLTEPTRLVPRNRAYANERRLIWLLTEARTLPWARASWRCCTRAANCSRLMPGLCVPARNVIEVAV